MLAAAAGSTRPGAPSLKSLSINSANAPRAPLIVDIVSLPQKAFSFGFRPQVLVTVRGLNHDDGHLLGALRAGFKLTAAEAEVALMLAEGQGPQTIAEARNASINTVRTQLRNIYDKLGVNRQSELAARLRPLR